MATETKKVKIHGVEVTLKTWDDKDKFYATAIPTDAKHDVEWEANSDNQEVTRDLIDSSILGYIEGYAEGYKK